MSARAVLLPVEAMLVLTQFGQYRSGRNVTVRCLTCENWRLTSPSANLGDVVGQAIAHWVESHR